MTRSKSYFILSAILVAALMGFAFFLQEVNARGAGGGFSGGSFRGGGGSVEGPRGGGVAEGPRGSGAAEGPRGGVAARGPEGGAVARGPEGGIAARPPDRTVNAERRRATDDWDHFYGPGWDKSAAESAAGTAVGFTDTLPAGATAVVVAGQTYYVASGVYYQDCFMGSDVNYCVVPAPQ